MANRQFSDIIRRRRPVTVPVTATVQHACRLMRDNRIGAVLVTEHDGRLAGLFTGRDAVGRVLAEALDPATTTVAAVMTVQPDTLRPDAHAIDALRMMQDGGYRHMPIVDGATIVGIVSHGDFLGQERARLDVETGSGKSCDPGSSPGGNDMHDAALTVFRGERAVGLVATPRPCH